MDVSEVLSRKAASDAVTGIGWRYVLRALRTSVPVRSMAEAAAVAARVTAVVGDWANETLHVDLRPDQVLLSLQSRAQAAVTTRETGLADQITRALAADGHATTAGGPRTVQVLEIAIDAVDIPAVRPFWKAVFGYVDEPGSVGQDAPLVDPHGQGPTIWFQQMDAPRPQRNRIHFDVSVPHDQMDGRILDAVAAGGRVTYDLEMPAFLVLADAEGNEACVTSWQGRD